MIEYLTSVLVDSRANQPADATAAVATEQIEVFRVTARGVGGTENAVVMLQSTYGRPAQGRAEVEGAASAARAGRLSWRELVGVN